MGDNLMHVTKLSPTCGLIKIRVGVVVWRRTTAEQSQVGFSSDLVARASGNKNGVARANLADRAVKIHERGAFKQKIKFLADLVVVALSGLPRLQRSFRQTLHCNGRVGAVKNTADDRAVFSYKRFLIFELLNNHQLNLCDFIKPHRLNSPMNLFPTSYATPPHQQ